MGWRAWRPTGGCRARGGAGARVATGAAGVAVSAGEITDSSREEDRREVRDLEEEVLGMGITDSEIMEVS